MSFIVTTVRSVLSQERRNGHSKWQFCVYRGHPQGVKSYAILSRGREPDVASRSQLLAGYRTNIVRIPWQWTKRSTTGQKPIEDKNDQLRLLEIVEFPIETSRLLLAAHDVMYMQCMQCNGEAMKMKTRRGGALLYLHL